MVYMGSAEMLHALPLKASVEVLHQNDSTPFPCMLEDLVY